MRTSALGIKTNNKPYMIFFQNKRFSVELVHHLLLKILQLNLDNIKWIQSIVFSWVQQLKTAALESRFANTNTVVVIVCKTLLIFLVWPLVDNIIQAMNIMAVSRDNDRPGVTSHPLHCQESGHSSVSGGTQLVELKNFYYNQKYHLWWIFWIVNLEKDQSKIRNWHPCCYAIRIMYLIIRIIRMRINFQFSKSLISLLLYVT